MREKLSHSLQIPGSSLLLYVTLPGSSTVELLRVPLEATEYVGDLKDAIITKFNKPGGYKADQLHLINVDGSHRTVLRPTQTLSDAGVRGGTELAVEFTIARACVGACA